MNPEIIALLAFMLAATYAFAVMRKISRLE